MFRHILAGVDESDSALAAVRVAADMAMRYDARLTLVHAFGPIPRYLGPELYDEAATRAISHGEQLLQAARSAIPDVPARTDLLEGPVADALLRVAEVQSADLLVIGSRGLGEISGLALGSVGHKLIQRAPMAVMIVKR